MSSELFLRLIVGRVCQFGSYEQPPIKLVANYNAGWAGDLTYFSEPNATQKLESGNTQITHFTAGKAC
jgi:hypothetical protein